MTAPHPDYSSIALVDLSYLFTRNYRGAGVKAPPNAGALRTLEDLAAIRDDVDHVILCLDGPPYLRRDRFEAYKAHREEPPPEEIQQKRALIEELKRLGYTAAKVKGYEADDIIATLSRVYSEWCPEIRIYGPDKDVAQCIRSNVVQIIPSSGKRQTTRRDAKKCHEDFGALPSQMAFYQAIVGDGTDGIPGVKGCGPAAAKTVIRELVGSGRDVTLESLANYLGEAKPEGKPWTLVTAAWNSLKLSLDLATLDTHVPLDTDALLTRREADPNAGDTSDIDLLDFEGNQTPMAPPLDAFDAALDAFDPGLPPLPAMNAALDGYKRGTPIIGADPNADQVLREQAISRGDDVFGGTCPDHYSPTGETHNGRAVFRKNVYVPGTPSTEAAPPKAAAPASAPRAEPAPAPASPAGAAPAARSEQPANDRARATGGEPPKPPAETRLVTTNPVDLANTLAAERYGLTDARLQPQDLRSTWTLAHWAAKAGHYKGFDSPEKAAMAIVRGREMGIDALAALSGFHIIEGKPVAAADLIRALAERDPNCEYVMCVESDALHAVWETKHRKHPRARLFSYTIEEARLIPSFWKKDRWGNDGNWVIRPKEMLTKTAASKLCREVYPGACFGLYCPEEINGGVIDTVGVAA